MCKNTELRQTISSSLLWGDFERVLGIALGQSRIRDMVEGCEGVLSGGGENWELFCWL